MADVVGFPARPAQPVRRKSAGEVAPRGTPSKPALGLKAFLSWHREFDAMEAAARLVTRPTHEMAVEMWEGHVRLFDAALAARGLDPDQIATLRREYTAVVRREFRNLKAAKMTWRQWMDLTMQAGFGAPRPTSAPQPSTPKAAAGVK